MFVTFGASSHPCRDDEVEGTAGTCSGHCCGGRGTGVDKWNDDRDNEQGGGSSQQENGDDNDLDESTGMEERVKAGS